MVKPDATEEKETPIDATFRALESAPDDERARVRFYERIMDAELYLLLEREPDGDNLNPRVVETEEGRFVLAFDRDDRLAAFLDAAAPYAALAGRRLVAMLAGRDLGVGLNLGVAPSASLLPPAVVQWLDENAGGAPDVLDGQPLGFGPPRAAPDELIAALSMKLGAMSDQIAAAHLVAARLAEGETLLLALVGVDPGVREAVAGAVAETVRLSGSLAGSLDVTFLDAGAQTLAAIERCGLAFDLPRLTHKEKPAPGPRKPGSDPARPPILRIGPKSGR